MTTTRASVDPTGVVAPASELASLLDALVAHDAPPDDASVKQVVAATRALRVNLLGTESIASFLGRLLQVLEDVESGTVPWSSRVHAVLRVAHAALSAWQEAVTAGGPEAREATPAVRAAEHGLETAEGALAAWRRTQQGPPSRGTDPERIENVPVVDDTIASLQRLRRVLAAGSTNLADRDRVALAGEIAQLQEVMQALQQEDTSTPEKPLEGLRNHCEGALRHLVEAAAQEVLDEARERGLRLALRVTGHVDPVDEPLGAALLEILAHLWSDSLECQTQRAAPQIDTVLRSEDARLVVEIGDPEAGTPWRDPTDDDDVLGRYPGLKRVRPFVEALQGLVWVEPAGVAGCRFRLTLPLASQAPHALLVRVGRHEIALPASAVVGVYDAHAVHTSYDVAGAFVDVEGVRVPILHLAFHLADIGFDELLREHVVVVGVCERRAALFAAGDRRTTHGWLTGEATGMWAGGLETEFGTFPMLHVGNLLGRSAPQQAAAESRAPTPVPEPETQGPRTVLVVDSSEIEREHLSTVIAEAGHDVVAVQSTAEAWSTLESRPVDLVICDLRLPEMNAQQLAERRRVAAKFKQVPVLLILSHAGEQAHLVVQQLGATAWVRSPLQREDVVAAIARLVRA